MPDDHDNQPATKRDLNEFRDATKKNFNELRDTTKKDLNELRDELVEQMRDMQTEVLRAFHDWARPVDIKLRSIPPIDERLGLIEERVSRLERGAKHQ
jgi:hypothetical protein